MKNLVTILVIAMMIFSANPVLAAQLKPTGNASSSGGINYGGFTVDNISGPIALIESVSNFDRRSNVPAVDTITMSSINNLTITQTSTVTSNGAGTAVLGSQLANSTLSNFGSIINTAGGAAVGLDSGGVLNIVNGGLQTTGFITATGSSGAAISINAGSFSAGSSITNYALGEVRGQGGAQGIRILSNLSGLGGIDNYGLITASSNNAIYISAPGVGIGSINNRAGAKITSTGGAPAAVVISGSSFGTLGNAGLVENSSTNALNAVALAITGVSTGSVVNSGIIQTKSSDVGSKAIQLTGELVGSINNVAGGLISSSGAGIYLGVTGTAGVATVNNGGVIKGDNKGGIYVEAGNGVLTLFNSGSIESSNSIGVDNRGIANIVNNGKISGSTKGISNSNIMTLTNNGTIISDNIGLFLNNGGNVSTIDNAGLIQGATAAILVDASGIFTLNNSGIVKGDLVGSSALANEMNINGTKNGRIIGNIDLGNGSTVDNGDTINFGAFASNTFTTEGTVKANKVNLIGALNAATPILLGGSTPVFTVRNQGVLNFTQSVTHNIPSLVVNNGGIVSVSAGRLVDLGAGVIDLNSGATMSFEVETAASYARIHGASLAVTSGGTLSIGTSNLGYIADGTILTNLFYGGSVNMTGINVFNDNSYIYKFLPQVGSNPAPGGGASINGLSVLVNREHSLASANPNDKNIVKLGDFIESLQNNDPALQKIITGLNNQPTAKTLEAAMKTLFPNISGGDVQAAAAAVNASLGTIESHLESTSNSEATVYNFAGNNSNRSKGIWGQTFGNSLVNNPINQSVFGNSQIQNSVWTEGYGSIISQSKRDGVEGYDANIAGFSLGSDIFASPTSTIGLAVSYGVTSAEGEKASSNKANSTSSNNSNFESKITSIQGSIYGTRNFNRAYIDGIFAFAKNGYDSKRTLFDGSIASRSSGGSQMSLKVSTGYAAEVGRDAFLTPFASFQMSKLSQDEYTETGSNADLKVTPKDINIMKGGVGLKFSALSRNGDSGTNLRLFGGFYHDFAGDLVEVTSSFVSAPTTSFDSKGATIAVNSVRGGVGVDFISRNSTTVSLDYVAETKAQFMAHTAVAKVKFAF